MAPFRPPGLRRASSQRSVPSRLHSGSPGTQPEWDASWGCVPGCREEAGPGPSRQLWTEGGAVGFRVLLGKESSPEERGKEDGPPGGVPGAEVGTGPGYVESILKADGVPHTTLPQGWEVGARAPSQGSLGFGPQLEPRALPCLGAY